MNSYRNIALVIVGSAVVIVALGYWYDSKTTRPAEILLDNDQIIDSPLAPEEQEIINPEITNDMNPTAVFTTNQGLVEIELFEDQMPVTVGNFVSLAESGFYDETKFHRVIEGFMIQGGDPNSRGDNEAIYGTGGPDEKIADEFVEGELLTNTRGTIAMANTGQPNSGGSQWFINLVDNTNLDFDKPPFSSKHPVFGRVTSGMDIVDAIGSTPTKDSDVPISPVVIETIEIKRN